MKSTAPWAEKWIWAALILLLPITSMPLIIRLVRSDSVAAPSALLLFGFGLVWFLPFVRHGGFFPKVTAPFLGFVAVAITATLTSNFYVIPDEKGLNPIFSQFSALVTLVIGAAFYFAFSLWPAKQERLAFTIRLLNWTGCVVLVWAGAQALAWYTNFGYPQWMRDFHELFSAGPLNRQRVLGFALEPSWLAHQLNMVFLPLWLAASLKKLSWHSWRVSRFTFENILLVGGVAILLLTLSRIGLIAFLVMLAFVLLRATQWASRKIVMKIIPQNIQPEKTAFRWQRMVTLGVFLGLGLLYLGIALGVGWILSHLDIRTAKLFQFDFGQEDPVLYYARQINIAARLVYWQAGWGIFSQYPWLGVGLGNAGFYMPAHLSNYAMGLIEVRQLLFRSDALLNIKCLWVRLLAETGIIGFSFFLAWLFNIGMMTYSLEKHSRQSISAIGLAGVFACIALVVEGFSLDTFALPYIWLLFGLTTAASIIVSQE
ncbi:MAG: O-antigen ligase family protein [Anaerolineaceae bacterium]|nr:O-antigen ligase family protein [Anaerolineaceae bacterium]